MIPFYKIQIDEDIEGMDFIALVDVPAHLKGFEYFNDTKKPVKMVFNEEKRIVTGVAIATDIPIYRNSEDIGEHYVVFNKEETFKIAQKMMQNGFFHNVNEMHDSNKQLDGVYLIESYFIDTKRGVKEPNNFDNQNLKDGTWITSYYVKNDKVWDDIKKGKFYGFSVEGWFDKTPINIKNNNQKKEKQMSEKKSIKDRVLEIFASEEISKFGEAMTTDGVSVVWDGEELIEGVELRVVTEEGEILAPDGEHAIQVEESIFVVVTEAGIITNIVAQEEEVMNAEPTEDLGEVVIEFSKTVNDKFAKQELAYKEDIKTLKEEIKSFSEKFDAFVNATEETKRKFNKTTSAKKEEVAGWKKYSK